MAIKVIKVDGYTLDELNNNIMDKVKEVIDIGGKNITINAVIQYDIESEDK